MYKQESPSKWSSDDCVEAKVSFSDEMDVDDENSMEKAFIGEITDDTSESENNNPAPIKESSTSKPARLLKKTTFVVTPSPRRCITFYHVNFHYD